MSAVLNKRSKRRKNKRQVTAATKSPVTQSQSADSNVTNGRKSKASPTMLSEHQDKCFICGKLFNEADSKNKLKKVNCMKNEKSEYYVCDSCRAKEYDIDWLRDSFLKERKRNPANLPQQHEMNGFLPPENLSHLWQRLHDIIQSVCSSVSLQNINSDELKSILEKLFKMDAHLLFQKLENEATIHLSSCKKNLLKQLTRGYNTPELAQTFVSMMLNDYQKLMNIENILKPYLNALNTEHLKMFGIDFEFVLKALYQQLIYCEQLIHRALPTITNQLRIGTTVSDTLSNDLYNKTLLDFLLFETKMIEIQGYWRDAQKLIDNYTDEQVDEKYANLMRENDDNFDEKIQNYLQTPTNQSCMTSTTSVVTMTPTISSNPVKSYFSADYFRDIHPPSVPSDDSADCSDNDSSSPRIIEHPSLILPEGLEATNSIGGIEEWTLEYDDKPVVEGTPNVRAFLPPNQFSFNISTHSTSTYSNSTVSISQQTVVTSSVFSSNLTSCVTSTPTFHVASNLDDGMEAPVCTPRDTTDDSSSGSEMSIPEQFQCTAEHRQMQYEVRNAEDSDDEYESSNTCRCQQCTGKNPQKHEENNTTETLQQATVGACECPSCQQNINSSKSESTAPTYFPTLSQFQGTANGVNSPLHTLPYSLQSLALNPSQIYPPFNTSQRPFHPSNSTLPPSPFVKSSDATTAMYSQMDPTWHQNNLANWMPPYQHQGWALQNVSHESKENYLLQNINNKACGEGDNHPSSTTSVASSSSQQSQVSNFSSQVSNFSLTNLNQLGAMSYTTNSFLTNGMNIPGNGSFQFPQTPLCLASAPSTKSHPYFHMSQNTKAPFVTDTPQNTGGIFCVANSVMHNPFLTSITTQASTIGDTTGTVHSESSCASSGSNVPSSQDDGANKLSPNVQQQIQRRKKLVAHGKLRQQIKKSSSGTQTSPAAGTAQMGGTQTSPAPGTQQPINTKKNNIDEEDCDPRVSKVALKLKFQMKREQQKQTGASCESMSDEKDEIDPGKINGRFGPNADIVCKEKKDQCPNGNGPEPPTTCSATSCSNENATGNNSSSSTTSSNGGSSKYCDCCYCEFFGNGGPPVAPTSKNYSEMRDRLRLKLTKNKLKQEGYSKEVMCENRQHLPPPRVETPPPQKKDGRSLDEILSFIEGEQKEDGKSKKAAKRARQKQRKDAEVKRQEKQQESKHRKGKNDNFKEQQHPLNSTSFHEQSKVVSKHAVPAQPTPKQNNQQQQQRVKKKPEPAASPIPSIVKVQSASPPAPADAKNSTKMNAKNKKANRKCKASSPGAHTVDHVFMPRSDIETTELDDIEKDVEHFKRFCLNSSAIVQEKKKINWNNYSFKKNNLTS